MNNKILILLVCFGVSVVFADEVVTINDTALLKRISKSQGRISNVADTSELNNNQKLIRIKIEEYLRTKKEKPMAFWWENSFKNGDTIKLNVWYDSLLFSKKQILGDPYKKSRTLYYLEKKKKIIKEEFWQ